MQATARTPAPKLRASARFPPTGWTRVRDARGGDLVALSDLCKSYSEPLRAFILSCGYSEADADDLVQDFLLRVTDPCFLDRVSPLKGRFRSWLLKCLRNHLATERARNHALKRGGGISQL